MPDLQIQEPIHTLIWEERERLGAVSLETFWGVSTALVVSRRGGWAVPGQVVVLGSPK